MREQSSGIGVGQFRVTIDAASLSIKSGNACIPRGSNGLTERVSREAKVPVPKHPAGNCHGYVANPCDIATAATAGGFEASRVRPPLVRQTGAGATGARARSGSRSWA